MTPRRLLRLPVHRGIERLEDRLLLTGSSILETESNNSIALANPVSVDANSPAEVSGEINVGGDVDLYQISLGFGDTFTAALTGYDPNVQYSLVSDLRLFDSNGQEMRNEPFGLSDPTLQYTNNTAGTTTFYLGVSDITNTAYDATNADNQGDPAYQFIGAYTLDLSVTSLVDAGDTLGAATDVPSTPIQLSGIIDTGGDADLYHVFLNAGDTLDVATDTSTLGGLGTKLRLFDQQGQPISTTGTANHVNFVAAAAGDYYLGVSAGDNAQYDVNTSASGSGTATGDYFVNFLITSQDHDDTTAAAHHISFVRDQPASQLAGRIANPLDVDFYRIDHLVVGDKIQLTVDTASVGSSLSSRLRVFGPNGQVNPDSGTGLDATQTYTITTAGDYFVGISGAENTNYNPDTSESGTPSSSIGDYQLGIEVDSAAALATETESNNNINTPNVVLPSGGSITGSITSGDVDYYMFTVSQPGLFTAQVSTPGSNLDSQLTILGSNQQPLFTSDDSSLTNVDPSVQMHLVAGTYWLQVKASSSATAGAKAGAYALSTTFTPANSPFVPQPTGPDDSSGLYPYAIDAADLNGDGIPDLITADVGTNQVSVLIGIKVPGTSRGDFSYKPATVVDVGNTPVAITANLVTLNGATARLDFNSDGKADLALINLSDNTVEILLGDGVGGFTPGEIITVGNSPTAVVAADFNNDGVADLAVTNSGDGTVTILLGDKDANNHGTGTFTVGSAISVGNPLASPSDPPISSPRAIIAGDFDGDSKLDLAMADTGDDTVTVLYGDGQGNLGVTAQDVQVLQLPSGSQPTSLIAAKFNSKVNNFIGFAVANSATDTVSMILGQGNRAFQINDPIVVRNLPQITVASEYMTSVATADFNGDGLADLVVSNIADPLVTVALGNGNGTFAPGKQYIHNATNSPRGIVTADFNNDGRADFATADGIPAIAVSVFGGRGDGTFLGAPLLGTNQAPVGLVVSDFNDDGFVDIFTANDSSNGSLLSGNGDATFQDSVTIDSGPSNAVATGDFNGDGRPDVVVTNFLDPNSGVYLGQLTVLLGNGDGTFAPTDSGPITLSPGDFAVAVGDFDHDGHVDLAVVTTQFDSTLTVLFGDGSGNFTADTPITVGSSPEAVAVGDFNGDGNLDIVTSNYGDGTLSVVFGDGFGGFGTPQTVAVGQQPGQLAVANFNGDISSSGHALQDIAVKSSTDNVVRILFGVENGADSDNFANANLNPLALPVADGTQDSVGYLLEGIVAADFNGDGLADIATANGRTSDISVFMNSGNGQFSAEQRFAIGDSQIGPVTIVSADFNRDGRLDLATSNAGTHNVSILLGDGTGKFALPGQFGSSNPAKPPLLVDVNGDGTPDIVTLDAQGRVLLRLGRPGQPGVFAPPLVINAASITAGSSAADFALFNDGSQHLLGILNRSVGQNSSFTLYRINHAGSPVVVSTLQLGAHYDRLFSGKLNADNRDDFAALDSGRGTLATFLRSGSGFVTSGTPVQIANAPTALLASNLGGNIASVLAASLQTGTVNLLNGNALVDYRGSTGPLGFDVGNSSQGAASPLTFDGNSAFAVGNFNNADGILDLVVAHAGSNTLSVLLGKSGGGFVDPQASQEIQAASQPVSVVAGKFNADAHLDLAVLEADGRVEVFLGDGFGNFQVAGSYDVGRSPVALSVGKVNADTKNDLMISNRSGDVVTLLGNGNGTFRTFTRAGQSMSLAVGGANIVVTNQSSDRVVVPGSQSASQRSDGVNAPSAVRLTDNLGNAIDLNADGFADMVVANSGGNNMLVYLGIGGGGFDLANPLSFAAGTDPVDVQVADLNGDGMQDVVITNYGSNDLSILLGTQDSSVDASTGKSNLLQPGVRLNVGQGPISTQVVLQPGHANPDLLVTNSISNSVYLLPGVGGGFFNDVTPTQFQTGNTPVQTVVGNFNGQMGFVTLNYASNSLTFYSSFSGGGAGQDISSGGSSPLSAVSFGLNSDGTTNLIVGNNGDGVFSVFEGSQAGLSLVNTFSGDFLDHPAALAVSGQGNDLQLLALDEGDETVHVFNRDTIDGQTQQTFIPGQTELAGVATGFLGSNTTGFGFVVSLIGALGISVEGFLDSTFTSDAAGGDGKFGHPFSTQFFEDLGSALNSGQQWVGSAVEGLGGMLGVHLDDQEVGAAVEDVMSLIFPHLPLQALPSLIHGMLESATHSHPSSPFATDQALEDFEFSPFDSSNTEVLFDVAQLAQFLSPTDLVQPSLMPLVKSLADGATSAFAPRATAPSDVAAGQGSTENETTESIRETAAQVAVSPIAAFAPQAIVMSRKLAADNSHHRVSKALQMSLGLPVSIPPAHRNQKSNQQTHKFNPNQPAAAEMEGAPGQLFALAAVMGSIGVGGWAHRFRRNRKHPQS